MNDTEALLTLLQTVIYGLPNFAGLLIALWYSNRSNERLVAALTALSERCAELETNARQVQRN